MQSPLERVRIAEVLDWLGAHFPPDLLDERVPTAVRPGERPAFEPSRGPLTRAMSWIRCTRFVHPKQDVVEPRRLSPGVRLFSHRDPSQDKSERSGSFYLQEQRADPSDPRGLGLGHWQTFRAEYTVKVSCAALETTAAAALLSWMPRGRALRRLLPRRPKQLLVPDPKLHLARLTPAARHGR